MKNSRKNKKVVVVVHDAGGAEIIGAYVQARRSQYDFRAFGNGPAARVFARLGIPLKRIDGTRSALAKVMHRHRDAHMALIGAPGWMTKTEFNALQEAKRAGLRTVVYMDSWLDDRYRFGYPTRGWQKTVPDVLWAGDRYALEHLRKRFPRAAVKLVRNQYFANEVKRYRALRRAAKKPDAILFMSTIGKESDRALQAILSAATRLRQPPRIRIRYHPADDRARYDPLVARYARQVVIERSREKDIVKDLIRARVVVGTETVAMAMAVLCVIPTLSIVPRGKKPMLPFPRIIRLRDASLIPRRLAELAA